MAEEVVVATEVLHKEADTETNLEVMADRGSTEHRPRRRNSSTEATMADHLLLDTRLDRSRPKVTTTLSYVLGSRSVPLSSPHEGFPGLMIALFSSPQAVDRDGSGSISPRELEQALINGDWKPFDIDTVHMLFNIFDKDRSGTIGYDEFAGESFPLLASRSPPQNHTSESPSSQVSGSISSPCKSIHFVSSQLVLIPQFLQGLATDLPSIR